MRIFNDAAGSPVSRWLYKAIKDAGHTAIGGVINKGEAPDICDEEIVIPKAKDFDKDKMLKLIKEHNIDMVIPSFDGTLVKWAKAAEEDPRIIISPVKTIETFTNKWETYLAFKINCVDTPATILATTDKTTLNNSEKYVLEKPIYGSGSTGIHHINDAVTIKLNDYIVQEKLEGTEYTVDCLFDNDSNLIYCVPRERLDIKNGKSKKGRIVPRHTVREIQETIQRINLPFRGMVNFQYFQKDTEHPHFIECNPRLAGGMALGLAATENWIPLIIQNMINKQPIEANVIIDDEALMARTEIKNKKGHIHYVEGFTKSSFRQACLKQYQYEKKLLTKIYPKVDWDLVKNVVFDIDGTLYDEFEYIQKAYEEIFSDRTVSFFLNNKNLINVCNYGITRWLEKGSGYPHIFEEIYDKFSPYKEKHKEEFINRCLHVFNYASNEKNIHVTEKTKYYIRSIFNLLKSKGYMQGKMYQYNCWGEWAILSEGNDRRQSLKWSRVQEQFDKYDFGIQRCTTYIIPSKAALLEEPPNNGHNYNSAIPEKILEIQGLKRYGKSVLYFGDREIDRKVAEHLGWQFVMVKQMEPVE